jgi:hypothetical protein
LETKGKWAAAAIAGGAAVLGYIAMLGGPEEALRKTVTGQPAPVVVGIELDPEKQMGSYSVTLRNPSWEPVVITGYRASASVEYANASTGEDGEVPLVEPKERLPQRCSGVRGIDYPDTQRIAPKSNLRVTVRPWTEPCSFAIRFRSSNGETAAALVLGEFGMLDEEELETTWESETDRVAPTQTCSDGAVVNIRDTCPPAPPSPPSEERAK